MKRLLALIASTALYFSFTHLVYSSRSIAVNSENSCTSKVLKEGEGCFLYKIKASNVSIPIYYYLPAQLDRNTKVVFAMHGEKRNAEDYRNDWRKIYNRKGSGNPNFILLAPQFEQKWFPKAAGYNLGNLFTEDLNTLNSPNQWAFTAIENIFTFIKTRTQINTTNYYLYGHSAGAQFVHRMVIFMPNAHIQKAVAAEAGSYTIPDESTEYPCGFNKKTGDPLPSVNLKRIFSTPMTIILGTKDNQPLSPKHDSYQCEKQQGSDRLARGEYFYTNAKRIAENRKEDFQWTLKKVTAAHIVPNTKPPIEDPRLVSCAALEFFPDLRGVNCK